MLMRENPSGADCKYGDKWRAIPSELDGLTKYDLQRSRLKRNIS